MPTIEIQGARLPARANVLSFLPQPPKPTKIGSSFSQLLKKRVKASRKLAKLLHEEFAGIICKKCYELVPPEVKWHPTECKELKSQEIARDYLKQILQRIEKLGKLFNLEGLNKDKVEVAHSLKEMCSRTSALKAINERWQVFQMADEAKKLLKSFEGSEEVRAFLIKADRFFQELLFLILKILAKVY